MWGKVLGSACETVSHYGQAREGDRTLLDALWPAARALTRSEGWAEAVAAAERGSALTASMGAAVGRAAYVEASRVEGTRDPGAVAVALVLRAAAFESRS